MVDFALRTRPSKDSPSETSLMHHPKKIYKKTELSNSTSCPSFTSKCSTVSDAESTLELSRSDLQKTEETEILQLESKEMPLASQSESKTNDQS